jgi:hypothetical protein
LGCGLGCGLGEIHHQAIRDVGDRRGKMKDNLGLGVMIQMLGGNKETVEAHLKAQGKSISEISFSDEKLVLKFTDGTGIKIFDDGQSCCESRYMTTDDDIQSFVGAKFLNAELRDAPNIPDDYGDHEVQFLLINTDKGTFTMESHNEHNGYYGGFGIVIREEK